MGGRERFTREYKLLLDLLMRKRKQAGLTQQELAVFLGKTQSHVSKVEMQDRELSILDLRKWCAAVGIPLNEIAVLWEQSVTESTREEKRTTHPL